jgi:hypothetical protein
MAQDPRAVDWWNLPFDQLGDTLNDFQRGSLSGTDSRYTQWFAGVVQARVVKEAADMQARSGAELTRSTDALVKATSRLGWFTLALVGVALIEIARAIWGSA